MVTFQNQELGKSRDGLWLVIENQWVVGWARKGHVGALQKEGGRDQAVAL